MSALSANSPVERPRYGDARRPWHPAFVEYMYEIVQHPNYAGMPSTIDDAGKIDWTIPSNRPRGSKNWDGNARRREWWRAKAQEVGIPTDGQWLSKTAKAIHPLGEKPCQPCGRIMKLGYVYPTVRHVRKGRPVCGRLGSVPEMRSGRSGVPGTVMERSRGDQQQ